MRRLKLTALGETHWIDIIKHDDVAAIEDAVYDALPGEPSRYLQDEIYLKVRRISAAYDVYPQLGTVSMELDVSPQDFTPTT